jgi:Set1/Ash2 histone methyltransferase complex subunit ASH2
MLNEIEMTNKPPACYCDGDRELSKVEVQCCLCLRFCHQDCISVPTGPMLPFMINYQFLCKDCSPTKPEEQFLKKTATFNQLCTTALANLTQQSSSQTFFSRDREILPFIDEKWDLLTFSQKKNKPTLHASVYKALGREDLFVSSDIAGELMIALREQSLEKIGPMNEKIYEIMNPNAGRAQSPSTSNPINPLLFSSSNPIPLQINQSGNGTFHGSSSANSVTSLANSEVTRRTSKRKLANENSINTKRRGEIPKLERLIPKSFPPEYPFNKEGYRYHLAEPDPHSPFRQKFDETEVWAGKPIPGHLYRTFLENECLLSLNDRAQQLKLNDDRLTVTGDKGYCSVRSTHCVSHGAWYYEVTITSMPSNTATRIGWAQHLANLQTPIGTDKFGYSWRSKKGTIFHEASGFHYSPGGYTENDVLGFLIILPDTTPPDVMLPRKYKKLPLVKFKNYIYFEERDDLRIGEMNLKATNAGKIIFYKNGVNQGTAFTNIYEGNYYAAISLYYGATVSANFGPTFLHPPIDSPIPWKPLTESIPETYCTHALNDLLFHISHDGKLGLD